VQRRALAAEVAALLAVHADKLPDDGRQRLVRHGHLPEREIMTGIGPVAVRCPRVRDRVGGGAERIRFSSAILPPYARGRLKEACSEEHARWSKRELSAKYVYFWADGIHVQARLEDAAQCLLVIIMALRSKRQHLLPSSVQEIASPLRPEGLCATSVTLVQRQVIACQEWLDRKQDDAEGHEARLGSTAARAAQVERRNVMGMRIGLA